MVFLKGSGGVREKIELVLEHTLLGYTSASLPLSVENVLSHLQRVKTSLFLDITYMLH